jgi:hypothetical protein
MANFVGVVTQQDEQTGVTLRARVTSPKAHYTAYQFFKCMVKKPGLTDEQAVTIDLNTVSDRLLENGVTGITSNLTAYMPDKGDNGTAIKYDVDGDNISDYFNSDGIVVKRPPYGANAVVGTLTIRVTKNNAAAERSITVSIEPYTAEELVQVALNTLTWDTIKGKNATESSDPNTNGMYNVVYPLNLVKTITNDLVENPIKVTWTVTEDALSPFIENKYRIDTSDSPTSGTITRPTYTEMYEQKDILVKDSVLDIVNSKVESAYGKTYYRIGGLTLKASINIEGVENVIDSVTFKLKTLSLALTNKEIVDYMTENVSMFNLKDIKYNTIFSLATINDTSERTIFFDTTGENSSVLDMYTANGIATITASNALTKSGIKVTSINWHTIDPDTVDTTPVAIPPTEYSSTGLQQNNNSMTLTLDPGSIPTKTKLVLRCVMSVNGYDGAISYMTLFYRFSLDNLTPENPAPDTGSTTTN